MILRLALVLRVRRAWSSWASRGFCRTAGAGDDNGQVGLRRAQFRQEPAPSPLESRSTTSVVSWRASAYSWIRRMSDEPGRPRMRRSALCSKPIAKRARYARSTSSLSSTSVDSTVCSWSVVSWSTSPARITTAVRETGLLLRMSSAPRKRRSPCTDHRPLDLAEVSDDRDGTRDDDVEVVARVTRPVQHLTDRDRAPCSLPLELSQLVVAEPWMITVAVRCLGADRRSSGSGIRVGALPGPGSPRNGSTDPPRWRRHGVLAGVGQPRRPGAGVVGPGVAAADEERRGASYPLTSADSTSCCTRRV